VTLLENHTLGSVRRALCRRFSRDQARQLLLVTQHDRPSA